MQKDRRADRTEADLRAPERQMQSLKRYAIIGGALILVSFAAALFGEVYVPTTISAMAAGLAASRGLGSGHHALMRFGFASYLVEAVCDVVLTLVFYVILRPVERNLALLLAFFRLTSTAVFGASEFFYLSAMLFSGNSSYSGAFSTTQIDAFTRFSFAVYGLGSSAPVFYGTAAVIMGYLIYRSGFLPGTLGALWIIGGVCQVANTFLLILAPRYAFFWQMAPMLVAMLALALWFLLRGVDFQKWSECSAASRAGIL